MFFRLLRLSCSLGLALACGVAVCRAQTEGKTTHGRELELSEPRSRVTITNFNALSGRSDLEQFEEQLNQSLQPFKPQGSLDGVLAPQYGPPPRPVVRNSKLKDELERRQNWMYLDPNEILPGMSDVDSLNLDLTKGREQKKKTPLEQFYQRLEQEHKPGAGPRSKGEQDPLSLRSGERDDFGSQDDSRLPGSIRDSAQTLKKLLNQENNATGFGDNYGRGSVSDLFGLGGNKGPSKDELEKHKAYMDQYRKVLESSTPAPASVFDQLKVGNASSPAPQGNLNNLVSPVPRSPLDPSPAMVGAIPNPTMMPDVNATALNQWNPFYNPQKIKVEPPKPAPLNVPMPEAPRRRF